MRRLRLAVPTLAVALTAWAVAQSPDTPPKAEPKPPAADVTPSEEALKVALALDQRLMAEAKAGTDLMANITHLSDVIGARLTGSANLRRANEWAAERMKSYGLSNVHLEPWTIPVGWERGTASLRLLEPGGSRALEAAAAGWSPGTKGKVVGDVVIFNARTKDDFAKYKGRLKNAVILRGAPRQGRPINDTAMGGFGGGRRGGAEAKGKGDAEAKGPRPKDEPKTEPKGEPKAEKAEPKGEPKAEGKGDGGPGRGRPFDQGMMEQFRAFQRETDFLRSEGVAASLIDSNQPQGLLVMSGGWREDSDRATAGEPIPSLYVTHEAYGVLYRLASRKDAALPRVELEVTNTFVPGPVTVYNTVGEITGSEKPDEFVVLGAHIDSWDLATGTTDNGTGTCVVLEAARLIAKSGVKPRRTIRFCLFSGEEQGLHGSRAFVKAHKDEMAKTSLCIVHDTGTGKVQKVGTQGRPVLKPIFEREFVSLLKDFEVKEVTNDAQGGSDHGSFDAAEVPGIMFFQDMSEYGFTHHTQTDTLERVKEPNLVQGAQAMAIAGLRVANLDSLLPRDKPERRGGRRGGAQ